MRHLPDVLAVIGASAIVYGIGMIHVPSAFIFAGVCLIAFGYAIHGAQK